MLFDAIVLAGGRSSRLGGTPKSSLVVAGATLLERAVDAVDGARAVVIVADENDVPAALHLDDRVAVTREHPPYGGPVAAIDAAIAAIIDLHDRPREDLLVIACDMPDAASAVTAVLDAARADHGAPGGGSGTAGFIAVDEQRHPQYLLAVYDTRRLEEALDGLGPDLDGVSMRAVVERLDLVGVEVPAGSTGDVDSWADAARFGIAQPGDSS